MWGHLSRKFSNPSQTCVTSNSQNRSPIPPATLCRTSSAILTLSCPGLRWFSRGGPKLVSFTFLLLIVYFFIYLLMHFNRCPSNHVCFRQLHLNRPVTNTGSDDSQTRDYHVSVLQNTSTIAIFFSGVSATALQYSGGVGSGFATPFNFLWLLSLVLSTTSAMQCQLGIFWRTSRPRRASRIQHIRKVSHFVEIATSGIPLILLGISSVAFLIGLVFFSFKASSKHSFLAIGITSVLGAVMLPFIFWLFWLL